MCRTVRLRCDDLDALRSTTLTLFAWSDRSVCPQHILTLSFSFSLIVFASASLFDPTWQINCSRLTLRSTWWAHSWYSGAPWFSAQHTGDQLQSRDWTTSSSQPRSLTLAQSSTPTSSTTAVLNLIVPTHTSGLTLDASTQTVQPCPTQPKDASILAAPHSASTTDASTQLPLTEFFLWCIFSKDPSLRTVLPPTNENASGASLPQPSDIATISLNSTSSASCTSGRVWTPVPRARLHSTSPPPPGLEEQALSSPHGIL